MSRPLRPMPPGKPGAGAKKRRPPTTELAATLMIDARALYDRAAATLRARGHLHRRAERDELALVCGIAATAAKLSRLLAECAGSPLGAHLATESPKSGVFGLLEWSLERAVLRGWVPARSAAKEFSKLLGVRLLLPHPRKPRRPRRPMPPGPFESPKEPAGRHG